jgi:hypothetical protein
MRESKMNRRSVTSTWSTAAAEANDLVDNKTILPKESISTRDADADEEEFFDAEVGRYVPVYPHVCGRFRENL